MKFYVGKSLATSGLFYYDAFTGHKEYLNLYVGCYSNNAGGVLTNNIIENQDNHNIPKGQIVFNYYFPTFKVDYCNYR